jgi:4'-phosphopantetheinyl transferase EntD
LPEATLLPEEAAVLGSAVDVRVREFTAVRFLARRALTDLGFAPAPILPGANREPMWPGGIVGSLTHCRGYYAAAVAQSTQLASLGIDAEPHDRLPDGVLAMVAGHDEREWIENLSESGVCWDRLLFSAKESVFKAWYPIARRWLGFHDVKLSIDPVSKTFRATLNVECPILDDKPLTSFEGRYLVHDALVLTAVAIDRFTP